MPASSELKTRVYLSTHFIMVWSLIMGRGGYKTGGGACDICPYEKGAGGGKSLSQAEGGTQVFGVIFTQ